jgi:thiol-disulfide isomerase/thioredoxin
MNLRSIAVATAIIGASAAAIYIGSGSTSAADAPTDSPAAVEAGVLLDFAFIDVQGQAARLSDYRGRTVVIAMRDTGCPVGRRYAPRLASLEQEYADRVDFLYLNVSPQDSRARALEEIEQFGFGGRYIVDHAGDIGRMLDARSTTETFLIDTDGRLAYRGGIDDQYGISYSRAAPRHSWLKDALTAVLAGEPVAVTEAEPEGCYLELEPGVSPPEPEPEPEPEPATMALPWQVTYHNRISRIIQDNCMTCHRAEGIAPFALETYREVYGYRGMIRFVVESNRMPPWTASPEHGEWSNDRSLSAADRRDLLQWIQAGAPEGDPADAPAPRHFAGGWNIGQPDTIIEIPQSFAVPAEGVVDYQYMYVKTNFAEDRWIKAMEIRPTVPQVVHHVLVFLEEPGVLLQQGGVTGFFAAMAPGYPGDIYPANTAKRLPAGAWLKFQLHYTPSGVAQVDRTQLGFIFADEPPRHEVRTGSAFNVRFAIPPHASNHEVVGDYRFREPGTIATFFPHMHLRGKAFRYELIRPDGSRQILLDVPRFDFNWQLAYHAAKPIEVAAGDILRATGWFDNSIANPWNPDPDATVRFGEQTFEEMMLGYFDWIPKREVGAGTATGAPR